MNKYHSEEESSQTRVNRNKNIYHEVNENDIENLNLTNNISVIDTDTSNLDIGKLKEILDLKYREKSSSLHDLTIEEQKVEENLEDTKEYDLKKAIDAARKERVVDYDKDRFKKIRESEYEILTNLDIYKKPQREESTEPPLSDDEKKLMDLINTVNINAEKRKVEKEKDLMSELISEDNTEVLEPIVSEISETGDIKKPTLIEEIEKTKQISKKDIEKKLEEYENSNDELPDIDESEITSTTKHSKFTTDELGLVNTFYTGNLAIKESDLDDFKDLQNELKSNNILIKVLIGLVVIIVIGLIVFLLNKFLNLGLF